MLFDASDTLSNFNIPQKAAKRVAQMRKYCLPKFHSNFNQIAQAMTTTAIWFQRPTLDALNHPSPTLITTLGIIFTEIGDDYLKATMPVGTRTHQPMGLLHGGASVALAETMGSTGAYFCVDPQKHDIVGLEINANHVRGVREGLVTGTARPIHIGKTTQLWEIRITDQHDKLVCISRITLAVLVKMPKETAPQANKNTES